MPHDNLCQFYNDQSDNVLQFLHLLCYGAHDERDQSFFLSLQFDSLPDTEKMPSLYETGSEMVYRFTYIINICALK